MRTLLAALPFSMICTKMEAWKVWCTDWSGGGCSAGNQLQQYGINQTTLAGQVSIIVASCRLRGRNRWGKPEVYTVERRRKASVMPIFNMWTGNRWKGRFNSPSPTSLSNIKCEKMVPSAGILEQPIGARNRVEIGLSYRPARLQRLAESIPCSRFLGSLKV
jgi:hypothetical protein